MSTFHKKQNNTKSVVGKINEIISKKIFNPSDKLPSERVLAICRHCGG